MTEATVGELREFRWTKAVVPRRFGLLTRPLPVNRRVRLWGESPRLSEGEIRGSRATPQGSPRTPSDLFRTRDFFLHQRDAKILGNPGEKRDTPENISRGAQSTGGSGNSVTVHSAPREGFEPPTRWLTTRILLRH